MKWSCYAFGNSLEQWKPHFSLSNKIKFTAFRDVWTGELPCRNFFNGVIVTWPPRPHALTNMMYLCLHGECHFILYTYPLLLGFQSPSSCPLASKTVIWASSSHSLLGLTHMVFKSFLLTHNFHLLSIYAPRTVSSHFSLFLISTVSR